MVRPYCRDISYDVVRATAFVLALVVEVPERRAAGSLSSPPPDGKETITFPSGELTLHGVDNFVWHGSAIWAKDVFVFLERHCAE